MAKLAEDQLLELMSDQARADREVRNKYMRFWRSLTCYTRKTPECVLAKYEELQRVRSHRGRLMVLFEDFTQAGEDWSKSTIVQNVQLVSGQQQRGKMVWLTEDELVKKYRNKRLAEFICQSKKLEGGKMKDHPDVPGELMYLCLDAEKFAEEEAEMQHASLNVGTEMGRVDLVTLAHKHFEVVRGLHLCHLPGVGAAMTGSCSKHSRPGACAGCQATITITDNRKQRSRPRTANKTRKKRHCSSSSRSARSSSTSSASSFNKKGRKYSARKAKKNRGHKSSSSSASSWMRPKKKPRNSTAKARKRNRQGSSSSTASSSISEAPTRKVKDRRRRAKHREVAATMQRRRR
jgi:hypothetical protein